MVDPTEFAVHYVDSREQDLGKCDPKHVLVLLSGEDSPERHDLLMSLRDRDVWLRCSCDRLLHPVRGRRAFLRIHQRHHAPAPGLGCVLCERATKADQDGGRGKIRRPGADDTLVLNTPVFGPRSDTDRSASGGGSSSGARYASQRGLLRSYAQHAGWNRLQAPLHRPDMWRGFRRVLTAREARLPEGARIALSQITWLPDEPFVPSSFGWRASLDWPSAAVVPEMWLIAVLDQGEIKSWGDHCVKMTPRDAAGREILYRIPRSQVATTVCTPPYLAFMVGHPPKENEIDWAPQRVVLEGIAGTSCPVPVESGEERRAVGVLQQLGVAYEKVLFPDGTIWPDFLIHEFKLILEVQGSRRDGYTEQKARSHPRMLAHYPGWRMVKWQTNEGQGVDDLRRMLEEAVNLFVREG